jgi:hypothetical protein
MFDSCHADATATKDVKGQVILHKATFCSERARTTLDDVPQLPMVRGNSDPGHVQVCKLADVLWLRLGQELIGAQCDLDCLLHTLPMVSFLERTPVCQAVHVHSAGRSLGHG